jgi:hypothetical protein
MRKKWALLAMASSGDATEWTVVIEQDEAAEWRHL